MLLLQSFRSAVGCPSASAKSTASAATDDPGPCVRLFQPEDQTRRILPEFSPVRGHQHGSVSPHEGHHPLQEPSASLIVQIRLWFVQEEHLGPGHQGPHQSYPADLSRRQRVHGPIEEATQPGRTRFSADQGLRLATTDPPPARPQEEVVQHRAPKQIWPRAHVRNHAEHRQPRPQHPIERAPAQQDVSRTWHEEAAEALEESRLAGPIRPLNERHLSSGQEEFRHLELVALGPPHDETGCLEDRHTSQSRSASFLGRYSSEMKLMPLADRASSSSFTLESKSFLSSRFHFRSLNQG